MMKVQKKYNKAGKIAKIVAAACLMIPTLVISEESSILETARVSLYEAVETRTDASSLIRGSFKSKVMADKSELLRRFGIDLQENKVCVTVFIAANSED